MLGAFEVGGGSVVGGRGGGVLVVVWAGMGVLEVGGGERSVTISGGRVLGSVGVEGGV